MATSVTAGSAGAGGAGAGGVDGGNGLSAAATAVAHRDYDFSLAGILKAAESSGYRVVDPQVCVCVFARVIAVSCSARRDRWTACYAVVPCVGGRSGSVGPS